jgi:hypothetical protein
VLAGVDDLPEHLHRPPELLQSFSESLMRGLFGRPLWPTSAPRLEPATARRCEGRLYGVFAAWASFNPVNFALTCGHQVES